jgi:hypothetical protein
MVPENKQKNDTNKLTTIAFKIIPIFHKKLLATPKTKTFFGAFVNFWAPPSNPRTTNFMGRNSSFIFKKLVLLGRLQPQILLRKSLPILWLIGAF